jgi:glycosyltransferase involved in cell wall biosynthesis
MVCYSSRRRASTGSMRILLFHNWYQQPGGEDTVVRSEKSLLESHGHDVSLLDADNQTIRTLAARVRTATSVAHSRAAESAVARELAQVRPDIVHVHNFFPLLTPAVLDACRNAEVPVVLTLHNYRLLCAGAMLIRDGKPCELCITGSTLNAVRHRCYRDSYPGSLAVAWMVGLHRSLRTFRRKVDRFIALSEFQKSVFVRAGYPPAQIAVKPNVTPDPFQETAAGLDTRREDFALYLGRLSSEKGISTMLKAWRDVDLPLRIAGTGPLSRLATVTARDPRQRVEYLGHIPSEDAHRQLQEARFLVMPSQCYEALSVVVIEAFAHGLPVLTSDLGSMAEMVTDGETGVLFEPGNARDLARKATWLAEHPDECRRMGQAARRAFEAKYTVARGYESLMQVYGEATEHAHSRAFMP